MTSFLISRMTVSTSSAHPGGILRQIIPRCGSMVVNVAMPSYPSSINLIKWIFLRSTRKYFFMVFNLNLVAISIAFGAPADRRPSVSQIPSIRGEAVVNQRKSLTTSKKEYPRPKDGKGNTTSANISTIKSCHDFMQRVFDAPIVRRSGGTHFNSSRRPSLVEREIQIPYFLRHFPCNRIYLVLLFTIL
jgi:hypothetical protein